MTTAPKKPMTDKQRKVYDCVVLFIVREGRKPCLREIAERIGLKSKSTVKEHIESLLKKGWLTKDGSAADKTVAYRTYNCPPVINENVIVCETSRKGMVRVCVPLQEMPPEEVLALSTMFYGEYRKAVARASKQRRSGGEKEKKDSAFPRRASSPVGTKNQQEDAGG